jgi:hypothetical protein
MKNKKAVIGAALTWLVATIIIIFIVIIFIYASSKLAEEKQIKNIFLKGANQNHFIESEKMLLAILEIDLDGKKVRDYILDGDYTRLDGPEFKEKLSRLPEPSHDGWDLYILENDDTVKKIKSAGTASVAESRIAEVSLSQTMKVKLFLDTSYIYDF